MVRTSWHEVQSRFIEIHRGPPGQKVRFPQGRTLEVYHLATPSLLVVPVTPRRGHIPVSEGHPLNPAGAHHYRHIQSVKMLHNRMTTLSDPRILLSNLGLVPSRRLLSIYAAPLQPLRDCMIAELDIQDRHLTITI